MIKNPRQAYNKIVEWFSVPEAQLSRKEICYYLHPDSDYRRCAIGCLLPLDQLRRIKEAGYNSVPISSIFHSLVEYKVFEDSSVLLNFLTDAQSFHDKAVSVDSFLINLYSIYHDKYKDKNQCYFT